MTAGPTLEGVSDSFTFVCPCEATVHVVGGVEQPHDCPLTEEQRQAIRNAAAAEHVDDGQQTASDETVQVDPLALSMQLLQEAFVDMRVRDGRKGGSKVPRAEKIALAHALAQHVQAQAARNATAMQQRIIQIQLADREAAIEQQQGQADKSGLVVARINPAG